MWAILPLKDFLKAKQRLAGVLSDVERRHLFQMMVQDVLEALSASTEVSHVLLVSDDPSAALLAEHYGVECLSEKALFEPLAAGVAPSGLNAVVNATIATLAERGVDELMVVHGDLPLIQASEIDALLASHRQLPEDGRMTIVSDEQGDGSNILMLRPSTAITTQYGVGSCEKHRLAAEAAGIACQVQRMAGASLDIDRREDLLRLCQSELGCHSTRYIREQGIDQRLLNSAPANAEQLVADTGNFSAAGMSDAEALALAEREDTAELMQAAAKLRDSGFGNIVTYSRKVFIPLTHLCRDVCHYCTFATTPKRVKAPYMSVDEVLASVKQAEQLGCKEALFTLGEKPELRYKAAREALAEMGFATTLEYVAHVAKRVLEETSVLPHINAGCMTAEELAMLRPVSASMGIMLESASARLCEKGMPHYGSPDKDPAVRLATLEEAGKAQVPFTSGILIGIGETRRERIESLLAIREVHQRHGHIQEIIVQNFRAKENTKMAQAPEPDLEELLWTLAVTRLIFGADMSIQVPPNLSPGVLPQLVDAGINDWGGVSPVTPDFVNPEAPWPHLDDLAAQTASAGKFLDERLTIYPRYTADIPRWLDPALHAPVLALMDAEGFARPDFWLTGESDSAPAAVLQQLKKPAEKLKVSDAIAKLLAHVDAGQALSEAQLERLFTARGDDFVAVCQAADKLRQSTCGDTVSYVVNRNINYTNVCYFKCQFCAFSKGKLSENLRGKPYDLSAEEISRRCTEAWDRGATEVCMQGGIHPEYTGQTYLDIVDTIRRVSPEMHIHAFSPLEIWQGAETLGLPLADYLAKLKAQGLDTLPGTAAEVLDDEVRAVICPDKINSEQWLSVMEAAHGVGLRSTATIMFGHVDGPKNWAKHLHRVAELQRKTAGFTEFVPLPFVASEAPIYLKGKARRGPTFRECLLMHAVARLCFKGLIDNIQASWVKMGAAGVSACLNAGVNDLGGTLMNETITRAAGASHGQETSPQAMEQRIANAGRVPRQRSTLYGLVPEARQAVAKQAAELEAVENTPASKYERSKSLVEDAQLIASA